MPKMYWSAEPDRIVCQWTPEVGCGCDLHYVAVSRDYLKYGCTLEEVVQELQRVAKGGNVACPCG